MTTPENLPDMPCHHTDVHVPHARYQNFVPVGMCPGIGDLFPADRLTGPADPFEGLDDDEEF